MPATRSSRAALVGCLAGLMVAVAVHAQEADRGSLSGTVVSVGGEEPVSFATVTLAPRPHGLLPVSGSDLGVLAASRSVRTDQHGVYRFPAVTPGAYRLYVRRIGYRPATLDVDLEGAVALDLSVGLVMAPIRLAPLTAVSVPIDMVRGGVVETPPDAWDRAARERWRQDTYLETDARVISYEDMVEAVTLGETDVLRALQQLPGVGTRDDWTAELWVRGAPGSQTRVYFDGLPLFQPYHAGGLSTALTSDALGGVFFFPGIRSSEWAAGAAGAVDLRSRAARGDGEWQGRVRLSSDLVSTSFDRRWRDGKVGAMLAVRRSWLGDRRDFVRDPERGVLELPNDYADIVARADVDLGNGRALEVSGLWARDWIDGSLVGGVVGNTSAWGTSVVRATVHLPLLGGSLRQSVGASLFDASVRQVEPRDPLAEFNQRPTQQPTENDVRFFSLKGVWTMADESGRGQAWEAGYELFQQGIRYHGAPPSPYSVPVYLTTVTSDDTVRAVNLWLDRWLRAGDRFSVRAGLRLDLDLDALRSAVDAPSGPIRRADADVAPQVSVQYRATDRLRLALSTGTYFQYEQTVAPAGSRFGPGFTVTPTWTLARTAEGALRAETWTLGGEYWIGASWLASASIYERTVLNMTIPDPGPGPTDDDRLEGVGADNRAGGIELGLRRLTGPWTVSLGYALAWSSLRVSGAVIAALSAERRAVDGGFVARVPRPGRSVDQALALSADHAGVLEFPAPWDRRHAIDASIMGRVPSPVTAGTFRIGASAGMWSGTPYTRIHPGWYDCSGYIPYETYCSPIVPNLVEDANAERSSWQTSMNVILDWTRWFSSWNVGAFVKVQNVFDAANAVTYAVSPDCRRRAPDAPFCGAEDDEFLPGLGRHVEVGARIAF